MNSISVNAPQLSDIVGGHFVDGVLDMNDINDEDMITTKTSSGTKMRMTVYNTYPEKGINLDVYCVKHLIVILILLILIIYHISIFRSRHGKLCPCYIPRPLCN